MSTRTTRAAKGTLTSFLQYGLQILLQVLLAPLILHVAGQETLGAYAVLMQAIGYLALVDLGFGMALNRFLAQAFGRSEKQFTDVFTTGRTFYLGSNSIFALLVVGLSAVVGSLFSLSPDLARQAQIGLWMLAGWAVIRTPLALYGAGLNATQNLAAVNIISIVSNASRLITSLGTVALGGGLVGLMVANIVGEILMVGLQKWQFQRQYPMIKPRWGIPDAELFKSLLKFGSQTFLINLTVKLVFQTDNLVVGYLYGAAAVSVYYITQMPATMAYQFVLRLADNATPAINELYARNLTDSLQSAYLRLHRYTWIMVIPVAIGVVVFSEPVITLWVGESQFAGLSMVVAIAIFSVQLAVAHVSNAFVIAQGQIRTLSLLAVAEGILNLLLSLALGRIWGLSGVMWATTIANIPTSFYLLWRGQQITAFSTRAYARATVSRVLVPSMVAVVVGFTLSMGLPLSSSWVSLFTAMLIWALIYAILAYFTSLNGSERTRIQAILRTRLKWATA